MGQVLPLRRRRASLLRELIGHELRRAREERGERLVDVAGRAGVSPQYLSEVERGRKDPSSEMVEAIGAALDLTVADLTGRLAEATRAPSNHAPSGPVLRAA